MGESSAIAARRRWLIQAGVLGSYTALPFPRAFAQSQSTLNALPRIALVIGNTRYREAPLKNPGNDAKAIASELQKAGFIVDLQLETNRAQLGDAIQAFSAELAKTKAVGLFYYAGHGAQLGWRNYLIPVDAEIEKLDDLRAKTVELNTLLGGLTKAANPMNVIILDACRDSPFGKRVPTETKGLSQFDAPPGSLLAYATSPGNTAADGEGDNGLYTESLLQEIKVPETKIEDVLKRVRLNERRKSQGRQIPWESTSLEDDFYFLPPRQIRKLSETELERQFNEELAVWEKIKDSPEPGPIEEYLRKNPSGRFSEIAQFQLDRILVKQGEQKIVVLSAPENPFSKGTARADTAYKLGDSYSYRETDLFTKLETRKFTNGVTEITDAEIRYDGGIFITDLLGNALLQEGRRISGSQFFVADYTVGKRWSTRYKLTLADGRTTDAELDFKVVAREMMTVPAGTFDAYRIDYEGWLLQLSVQVRSSYWIASQVRRPIAQEILRRHRSGKVLFSERRELTAYTQG